MPKITGQISNRTSQAGLKSEFSGSKAHVYWRYIWGEIWHIMDFIPLITLLSYLGIYPKFSCAWKTAGTKHWNVVENFSSSTVTWVLETALSAPTEALVLNFFLRTGHHNVLSQINCPYMKPTQSTTSLPTPCRLHLGSKWFLPIVSLVMLDHRLSYKQLKVQHVTSLDLETFSI